MHLSLFVCVRVSVCLCVRVFLCACFVCVSPSLYSLFPLTQRHTRTHTQVDFAETIGELRSQIDPLVEEIRRLRSENDMLRQFTFEKY